MPDTSVRSLSSLLSRWPLVLMMFAAACSSTELSSPASGTCRVQTVRAGDVVLAWSTENTGTAGIRLVSVHYDGRTEAGKLKFSHHESSVANEVVSPRVSSDIATIFLDPIAGETVAANRLGGSYGFRVVEVQDNGPITIIVEPQSGCPK